MISLIIPAHNEQSYLASTLQAIHESAIRTNRSHEVIVVDDASTDNTADIAKQNGATVLSVNHRQIAATRNAGARVADGEHLFFVDADTIIHPLSVQSALRCMNSGAIGGGALTRFEGNVPLYSRLMLLCFGFFMKLAGVSSGAFMFCTRDAFDAVGGFNESYYGGEDAAMSLVLKRQGRFVVLMRRVVTSGRRVRSMHGLQMLATLLGMVVFPERMLTNRSSVEKVWYDSNRENDDVTPTSLKVRTSNAIALLIMLTIIVGPIIGFLPLPHFLTNGPLGDIRFGSTVIRAHMGLILWPISFMLLRNLFQPQQWPSRLKAALLLVLSAWFAWRSLRGVYWMWGLFCHWLVA